jgi:hypothetical protein
MNISKLPESDNVTEGALVVLSIDVEIVLSLAFAEIEISDNDADAVELSASAAATILVDSFFSADTGNITNETFNKVLYTVVFLFTYLQMIVC